MKSQMTIIRSSKAVLRYPLEKISKTVQQQLLSAMNENKLTSSNRFGRATLIALLECYLDVTNQELDFSDGKANEILSGFIGALQSDEFAILGKASRNTYTLGIRYLMAELVPDNKEKIPLSEYYKKSILTWESLYKDSDRVRYWHGWFIDESCRHNIPLHWIYKKLGAEYCDEIEIILQKYYASRKASISNSLSLFVEFFRFISLEKQNVNISTFSDAIALKEVFKNFAKSVFTNKRLESNGLAILKKRWNDWVFTVEAAFFSTRSWAEFEIPKAENSHRKGFETHITADLKGNLSRDKFLIPIPLELSDEKAIEILINDTIKIVKSIEKWSEQESQKILINRAHSNSLIPKGNDLIKNGRFIGNRIFAQPEDIAATFSKHSFHMFDSRANFIGVKNFSAKSAAIFLGIPISGSLDSLCYLLISQHTEITNSFLCTLELHNENGGYSCLIETENGYALKGYKNRRGTQKAEQIIYLNDKSIKVFKNIIEITNPLRVYLKSQGNPNWQKLLLDCSKGLSQPGIRPANQYSPYKRDSSLVEHLKNDLKISNESASYIATKLSFTTFRATKALTNYFEHGDEFKLANALGHAKYREHLIEHYLAKVIRDYLRSRSIRKFQTTLVTHAMGDSSTILTVTGFKSRKELDKFMENYALNIPSDKIIENCKNSSHEVLINVSEKNIEYHTSLLQNLKLEPTVENLEKIHQAKISQSILAEIKRLKILHKNNKRK